MEKIPVILIFDIGKTNKKRLLYNEQYDLVFENSIQIPEILDEDGFNTENITALTHWIRESIHEIKNSKEYLLRYTYYAAYGASFVYLDEQGNVLTPLYNYLKPLEKKTKERFEENYGPINKLCLETASPDLDNLNSGLQLFRLKVEKLELFSKIKWALHLPQYIHYLVTGEVAADITSIGCHTLLWNYRQNRYHDWVIAEGLDKKLPPITSHVGLHDSSAALIPYLHAEAEPFVLISTGTWCISLNPFNQTSLTVQELQQDTLCYLTFKGTPVKASRLFAGKKHEDELSKIKAANLTGSAYESAYEKMMLQIIQDQIKSTDLILNGSSVKRIYVDGGFSKNEYYMKGLAKAYPEIQVFAAEVPNASSLGAALAVHDKWNTKEISQSFLKVIQYADAVK